MKEKIYTIPLMDAFKAEDECPFCYIQRNLEQYAISFILGSGSAYMEDDIRMETDKTGFCRTHYKMMYDYGNRLGSALILSTHMKKMNEDLKKQMKEFKPGKSSMFAKMKKVDSAKMSAQTALGQWIEQQEESCYVCNHIAENYPRYLDTFFEMYQKDPQFVELVKKSKGFCLLHLKDLVEWGDKKLSDKKKEEYYSLIFRLMEENMTRLQGEVELFTEKFDYQNKDKPWGNSKDSIQRCMQKLGSGYPADPVFQADR
jgi:hypothetical protein